MFKPFVDDAKLPKFCAKCYSLSKLSDVLFGFVYEKPERLVGEIETWHVEKLDPVWRKASKQQLSHGSRSL